MSDLASRTEPGSRPATWASLGRSALVLQQSVGELRRELDRYVRQERWTAAALAAAGLWQATDDELSGTSSTLVIASGKVVQRAGAAGRLAGLLLESAVRLRTRRTARPLRGRADVDTWREGLVRVAVATAALADAGLDPDARERAARRARELADVLPDPPRGLRDALIRIPSSFRSFDQHPDDLAALVGEFAARWPDRWTPVVVVGVRTSGSYLAPFTAAALHRAGYDDVALISARPDQPLIPADAETLRRAAARGALALVVDDPPASGQSVATVCAQLRDHGLTRERIVAALAVFDDVPALPAPRAGYPTVTLAWPDWSVHRRIAPEAVVRDVGAALSPSSVRLVGELPAPEQPDRAHTRRLYRVEVTAPDGRTDVRTVLATGTGLGFFGDHDVAVAYALGDRVPAVLARGDAVLHLAWPEGGAAPPPSSEVVDYVLARHDVLAVPGDRTARLRGNQPVWEVASNHLSRGYGKFWPVARVAFVDRLTRRLLRTSSPSVPDGDMRPGTWLRAAGGRVVKTSFSDRAFSNFDLACFDDRFDVVGAAVHTGDHAYARELRIRYEARAGRTISPERWLAYELVHLWDLERHGLADSATVSHRKTQAMRRYLAEVLLAGVTGPEDGPVVALDVDGVLETDLLGFKAPTPLGVLCLRALSAHGYRTVVATGRSIDDVVELADVFRLAGGAAEYGSVLHVRGSSSVTPLIGANELGTLDGLRQRLAETPAVHVDRRHRFSVRAATVDARGRLHTLVPEDDVVPVGVRAVRGEAQTDFVSAGIDKADGARALVEELGEGTVALAVGDTAADAGLLEWAPLSVVPRHADAQARASAGRVAARPYQRGLADAVAGLIGHRPGRCPLCAAPDHTEETRIMLSLLRVQEGTRLEGLIRSIPLLRASLHGG